VSAPEPAPGAVSLAPCPGCGEQTLSRHVACRRCYLLIPSDFKERFSRTRPSTTERKRVVAEMRAWLRERPGLTT